MNSEIILPEGIQSIIVGYVIDLKFSKVAESLEYDRENVSWYYSHLNIQKQIRDIIYLVDFIELFSNACAKGNITLVMWIYYRMVQIEEHDMLDCCGAFRLACIDGNLKIAKWLYDTFDLLKKRCGDCNKQTYRLTYLSGYTETAEWLEKITLK